MSRKRSNLELRHYFTKGLGWGWFRQYQSQLVFNFLIEAADFCKGGVILDAGAGHQRYKPFFENCLYISQEHPAGIKAKNMQQIQYDLISPIDKLIPLKNNSIEGVLSTSVIEHLRYPDRFCREAYRVLKPGGKLFINVPFAIFEHEAPFDYNRPTRYGLKSWLCDAGFKKMTIVPTSSMVETVTSWFPVAVYSDIMKTGQGPNFRETLASGLSWWRKIARLSRLFLACVMYVLARGIGLIVKFIADRGPYPKCNFPVGWIAVATKDGKIKKQLIGLSKEKFLELNSIKN